MTQVKEVGGTFVQMLPIAVWHIPNTANGHETLCGISTSNAEWMETGIMLERLICPDCKVEAEKVRVQK